MLNFTKSEIKQNYLLSTNAVNLTFISMIIIVDFRYLFIEEMQCLDRLLFSDKRTISLLPLIIHTKLPRPLSIPLVYFIVNASVCNCYLKLIARAITIIIIYVMIY